MVIIGNKDSITKSSSGAEVDVFIEMTSTHRHVFVKEKKRKKEEHFHHKVAVRYILKKGFQINNDFRQNSDCQNK